MMKNENEEIQGLEIEQMLIPEYNGAFVPKYFKTIREYFELDSQVAIIKNIRNRLRSEMEIIQEGYGRADIKDDNIIKDKEAYLYIGGGPFVTENFDKNSGIIKCMNSIQITFKTSEKYKRPQDGMSFGYFIHIKNNYYPFQYGYVFYGHSPLYAYLSLASSFLLDIKII